ncbi:hypothetical protein LXA47_26275 [Massilia sp. P8910]|uniref:hypothetical protein n=1 Tax=Massilia antarctica TaxID=2765360 RepID=UPI001E533FBA|nr:hypothetical protein [Massilia antarctica]MCE3607080.1 hypothetical protein [Massilia antarctica]
MKTIVSCLLIVISIFSTNSTKARQPVKKFENPAFQFVGTWSVVAYDWREFKSIPIDLNKQLSTRASSFPIGQKIRIKWTGLSFMPGNYNTEKMNFDGPIGEALEITILTPYEKDLCIGYWSYLCKEDPENYVRNFMIVEIEKWDSADRLTRSIWPDVKPVEYSLVDFSKSHNIDVWFDKHGDIILPINIDGKSTRGKNFGILGVRLKRMN